MWIDDVKRDPETAQACSALLRHGFRVTVQGHTVLLSHPRLKLPWRIESRSELLCVATPYSNSGDLDDVAHGTVWDEFESRRDRPSPSSGSPGFREHEAEAEKGRSLQERLAKLEAENRRLREQLEPASKQRDEWKRRALKAEARVVETLGTSRTEEGTDRRRFETLRRFIAKEFHPDHFAGDGLEKLIRAEIFKKIWPQIEGIK